MHAHPAVSGVAGRPAACCASRDLMQAYHKHDELSVELPQYLMMSIHTRFMTARCRQRTGSEAGRAGSMDGRKAVFRNREQEANDPDFQRGFDRWGGGPCPVFCKQ